MIMQVRKILGGIALATGSHAIAKLTNGRYAVGDMSHGKTVPEHEQLEHFDAAFDLWLEKTKYPKPKK